MENNEIYIDGVNVAGCEFFNDCECKLYKQEYWERTDTTYDFCKEHPRCEFKATAILERLEQENETLKNSLKEFQYSDEQHLLRVIELEQENKELKTCIEMIKNTEGQAHIEGVRLAKENEQYRSALDEILEMAKFAQSLPCGSGNLEDCLNCDDDTTNNGQFCMEKRIHDIKTKCVEVLNHSEG